MAEQNKPQQSVKESEEELTSDYANNVFFMASVWDLKIIFGELAATNDGVDWHTSITVPWSQAKLMSYYLSVNIAAHESEHGRVRVPASMLPPDPPAIREEDRNNETVKALLGYIDTLRQKFLADNA